MPTQPHEARTVAEGFGTDANRYDRARPSYPVAMVDRIVAATSGKDTLDVGCGTGIAARQFRAAGCAVLGVEPDARMAELARDTGIPVEVATIEDWDPAGRTFDLLTAGQAWHWVNPEKGAAKAAEVLRPGGRFAAFWNAAQTPPEVAAAFGAVYQRIVPNFPGIPTAKVVDMYSTMATRTTDGLRTTEAFDKFDEWRFDWELEYTRADWLAVVPTYGGFTQYAPDQQEAILTGLGEAVDAAGGRFTMRYTAVVGTAVRL